MKESCQTRRMYGHDYAACGTYEVTIVVADRLPVFGEIVGSTKVGGETPHLKPSVLGQTVLDAEIPKIHHYYPMVDVWQVCLMPDHLHMIVRINRPGAALRPVHKGRCSFLLPGPTICPNSRANTPVSIISTCWQKPSARLRVRRRWLCKDYAMHAVTDIQTDKLIY